MKKTLFWILLFFVLNVSIAIAYYLDKIFFGASEDTEEEEPEDLKEVEDIEHEEVAEPKPEMKVDSDSDLEEPGEQSQSTQ